MHAPPMRFACLWLSLTGCIGLANTQPAQSTQDVDHDGVVDVVDKCPYQPGPDANSGCPIETRPPPPSSAPPPPVEQVPVPPPLQPLPPAPPPPSAPGGVSQP